VRAAALLLAVTACAVPVDPEPLGDYTTWKRLDVRGPAPGHGDTYRVIYVNPIAADPAASLTGGYPDGAIVVKEIRDDVAGAPGDLRYLAIMRQLQSDPEHADEGGWLFTQATARRRRVLSLVVLGALPRRRAVPRRLVRLPTVARRLVRPTDDEVGADAQVRRGGLGRPTLGT
jgi:hypothetical protein